MMFKMSLMICNKSWLINIIDHKNMFITQREESLRVNDPSVTESDTN